MIPYIKTSNSISFVLDGRNYSITSTMPHYPDVIEAIKSKNVDALRQVADISRCITVKTFGRVVVTDSNVYYNKRVIGNTVVTRILENMREGFDIEPIALFLDKLMTNPTESAIDELYLFLESSGLPITPDGDFLAYKVVTRDYKDKYTGTMDNSIGSSPSMDRTKVDPNRHNLCSSGLHFCGFEYVKSFYSTGDRLVLVKINPANVVSIPADYDNTKGRAWTYDIIQDVTHELVSVTEEPAIVATIAKQEHAEHTAATRDIVHRLIAKLAELVDMDEDDITLSTTLADLEHASWTAYIKADIIGLVADEFEVSIEEAIETCITVADLIQAIMGGSPPKPNTPGVYTVEDVLQALHAEDITDIDEDTELDALDVIDIVVIMEECFSIDIDEDTLGEVTSLAQFVRCLNAQLGAEEPTPTLVEQERTCPNCGSHRVHKKGTSNNRMRFKCQDCEHNYYV